MPLVRRDMRDQITETQRDGENHPCRKMIAIDEGSEWRRSFLDRLPSPVHQAVRRRVLCQRERGKREPDRADAANDDPHAAPSENVAALGCGRTLGPPALCSWGSALEAETARAVGTEARPQRIAAQVRQNMKETRPRTRTS